MRPAPVAAIAYCENGAIMFRFEQTGSFIRKSAEPCLRTFEVHDGGGPLWSIAAPGRRRCLRVSALRYGAAPSGYDVKVPAKVLRNGWEYEISGSDDREMWTGEGFGGLSIPITGTVKLPLA